MKLQVAKPLFVIVVLGLCTLAEPALATCPEGTIQIGERRIQQGREVVVHPVCQRRVRSDTYRQTSEVTVQAMLAWAQSRRWTVEEMARLERVLHNLGNDAGDRFTVDEAAVSRFWASMHRRSADAALLASAGTGRGPALWSSGWQSGAYEDCALFALATAAGRPYSLLAAEAGELVRAATWRSAAQRENPQLIYRAGEGLYGGEVVLLAEMNGRADYVTRENLDYVLGQGRPIIVTVAVPEAGAHAIVLSRVFEHAGATWFEAIDSMRSANAGRLFFSAAELQSVLLENGVTYQPDVGRTPSLLRQPGGG